MKGIDFQNIKRYFRGMATNMDHTYQEHREWLSQLDFYQDEIKTFQNELSRVVAKHSEEFPMIEHVEEYRAILSKKLQHIHDLRHRLTYHHWKLTQPHPLEEHEHLKNDLEQFVKDFEVFKNAFRRFAAHND